MTHPGEQYYPEGVHWDDPLTRGTLPDFLSRAAARFAARPAFEFRDRAISYRELESTAEVAAAAFLRAGYGKNDSIALFLGNSPDHPVNFFGALKTGARIVHLSPLDGERASSANSVPASGLSQRPRRSRGAAVAARRSSSCKPS